MLSNECLNEFRNVWLPHMTSEGIDRLIDLLEKDSPLLIHGSFARAVPQGCLATHVAWNHPVTEHLTMEAGICWLNKVAGLNPATSLVIREWDKAARCDITLRQELLFEMKEFRRERQRRVQPNNKTCGIRTRVAEELVLS
jgi:hypothetical protein